MNKLLTNFPVTLTEEQKNVLKLTLSAVLQDDPITKYWRPTVYENGDITWALVPSESEPTSQNIKGPSGFTPQFQIDASNAEWQVTYDGTNWTDLGIIASGARGPRGIPGQDGTPGADGISPTISTSAIPKGGELPYGGTQVKISGADGEHTFNVLNGEDGTGSSDVFDTTNTMSGAGTDASPYGVKTSVIATQEWVNATTSGKLDKASSKGTYVLNMSNGGQDATWLLFDPSECLTYDSFTDETEPLMVPERGMSGEFSTSDWGYHFGMATSGIDANKQYGWTTNGWSEVTIPSVPDITPSTGLSATGHTVGMATSGIDADKQYAWTTNGWAQVDVPDTSVYLPLSGGTVAGQLVVSGGSSFDQQFLKLTRENVNGHGRIGLGQYGSLALKADDSSQHTTQVNISPNTSNDQLVQVQHNGSSVGYLIPAVTATTTAGLTNDGILHIILES